MITTHEFTLVIEQQIDRPAVKVLFERYPGALMLTEPAYGTLIRFSCPADSLIDAILTAVRDLDGLGLSAIAVRDDDDMITLAAIAERIGRSREAVRLWSIGRTGPGGFPSPSQRDFGTTFYRWSQVAPWLRDKLGMPIPDNEPVLAAVNLALQLRAMAPRVRGMDAIRSLLAA